MKFTHRFVLFIQLLLLSFVAAEEADGFDWKHTPPPELKIGDLVFRKGRGLWTKYFIRASSRDPRFSHVGIVVRTMPSTLILHSDGNDLTGVGQVRTEDWPDFFEIASECAVYRYDGSEETARAFARQGLQRLGVPFDSSFDMSSTNSLYCTELIREVVNEAAGTNVIGFTILNGHRIIALDDIYHKGFKKVFDSSDGRQQPERQR